MKTHERSLTGARYDEYEDCETLGVRMIPNSTRRSSKRYGPCDKVLRKGHGGEVLIGHNLPHTMIVYLWWYERRRRRLQACFSVCG